MNQRNHILYLLTVVVFPLMAGYSPDATAQARCFGESYLTGALAGAGNCDGLRAGLAAGLVTNPAHVVWRNRWSAGGGYRQLYGLDALTRVWAAVKYRHDSWGIGISMTHFGETDFYTETEAAVCFGLYLRQNLTVGLRLRNMQLAYTPTMPNYTGLSAGAGAIYQPLKEIIVTGAISDLLRSNFIPGYRLPGRYHLSLAFILPERIQLGVAWRKNGHDRDLLGLGQRLGLAPSLYFLSAIYFDPARFALGGEIILRGQTVFYTYLSHPDLGGTHYVEFEIGK